MEEIQETLELIKRDFENRTFRINEPIFVIMRDFDFEYGYEHGEKSFEYSNVDELKEKFINDIANSKYFQDEFVFETLHDIDICSENEEYATRYLSYTISILGEFSILDYEVIFYEY